MSTLLPTSLVNTMSSDNDKSFQCQETGHMAHYCPPIRCFNCDRYGYVATDCPDKIPPSGTPAHHRNNTTNSHDRSTSRHHSHNRCPHCIETGTGTVFPDLTHAIPDIGVQAIMTLVGVAPDHFIDLHIIAPTATEAQAHTATTMIHYTADLHPIDIFPEMIEDPNNTNPTDNITNQHKDLLQVLKQQLGNARTEDTSRSPLTTHPQSTTAQMIRIVTPRMI